MKKLCAVIHSPFDIHKLSIGFPHTILILIQATQAGRWLIFCQPVVHRLLTYGNENDNGYDKHLRMQTDLIARVCESVRNNIVYLVE